MHSITLFNNQFPDGDKGGNLFKIKYECKKFLFFIFILKLIFIFIFVNICKNKSKKKKKKIS